jgi:hypothetical protein
MAAMLAITVSACLVTERSEEENPEVGAGGGSGSDISAAALVVSTPRDHSLEFLVTLSSVAVVIVPSLRRRSGNDAPRTT